LKILNILEYGSLQRPRARSNAADRAELGTSCAPQAMNPVQYHPIKLTRQKLLSVKKQKMKIPSFLLLSAVAKAEVSH
jgi:hypothetical protein